MQSINHGSFSLHMNTKPTLFTKKATLSPLNGFCTSVNKPIVCICMSLISELSNLFQRSTVYTFAGVTLH